MKPRDRIASHLRRILVAAGMALPQAIHADTSTPNGNKGTGKKPPKGETKKPPPESHHYQVVDMLPEPYIQPTETGTVTIRSTPTGASIIIDGKDTGRKTPLNSWVLPVGLHAVTLKSGTVSQNFTVEIVAEKLKVETRDLRPSPAPEPKK